jgi:hypothetical protein
VKKRDRREKTAQSQRSLLQSALRIRNIEGLPRIIRFLILHHRSLPKGSNRTAENEKALPSIPRNHWISLLYPMWLENTAHGSGILIFTCTINDYILFNMENDPVSSLSPQKVIFFSTSCRSLPMLLKDAPRQRGYTLRWSQPALGRGISE